MFKRVEKRRRRQEKEEELGLDEETKEVLGLHDTDSDESDTSSSSENEGSQAEEAPVSDGEEQDNDELVDGLGEADDCDDEESNQDKLPEMSVTAAVADPVYLVSLDPETKACILCPGKLLKNATMADVHRASKVSQTSQLILPCCLVSFNVNGA